MNLPCETCITLPICLATIGDGYPDHYIRVRNLSKKCSFIHDYIYVELKIYRREMNGGSYNKRDISFVKVDEVVKMFHAIRRKRVRPYEPTL